MDRWSEQGKVDLTPATSSELPREFFQRPTTEVARDLLGCLLVRREAAGDSLVRLVEVEAYLGPEDPACHTSGGRRSQRVATMWGPAGHLYVYLIYGLHHCANVVTGGDGLEGAGEAVLLRGAEVVAGEECLAQRRPRGRRGVLDLLGPGKLCQGLGVDRSHDGLDLCRRGEVWLTRDEIGCGGRPIEATPRIGVDYAGEAASWPLRFVLGSLT